MAKKMSLPFKGSFNHTQGFGARPSVYSKYGLNGHDGDDWVMPEGTPLFSPIAGKVIHHGNDAGGWGIYIQIWDSVQNLLVNIAHCSGLQAITGAEVRHGQQIAFSGNTGFSEAPHVHVAAADTDGGGNRINTGNGFKGWYSVLDGGKIQLVGLSDETRPGDDTSTSDGDGTEPDGVGRIETNKQLAEAAYSRGDAGVYIRVRDRFVFSSTGIADLDYAGIGTSDNFDYFLMGGYKVEFFADDNYQNFRSGVKSQQGQWLSSGGNWRSVKVIPAPPGAATTGPFTGDAARAEFEKKTAGIYFDAPQVFYFSTESVPDLDSLPIRTSEHWKLATVGGYKVNTYGDDNYSGFEGKIGDTFNGWHDVDGNVRSVKITKKPAPPAPPEPEPEPPPVIVPEPDETPPDETPGETPGETPPSGGEDTGESRITVTSTPAGAKFYIDSFYYNDLTPSNEAYPVEPGRHEVIITLKDYSTHVQNVIVGDGEHRHVHVYLVPEPGVDEEGPGQVEAPELVPLAEIPSELLEWPTTAAAQRRAIFDLLQAVAERQR